VSIVGFVKPMVTHFGGVVERLGSIPLDRIAARPFPGAATEQDLLDSCENRNGHIYELVDGVLVEKPMSTYESLLAMVLVQLLLNYLDEHPLGTVVGEAGLLRLMPGLVRASDVSFISWDRFPGRRRPADAIFAIAPDLAVEIISLGNTEAEMDRKLHEYFGAGAKLVWYVYPNTHTACVYTSPEQYTTLSESETLDGGAVLPGFRLSIREWFERAWPEESD